MAGQTLIDPGMTEDTSPELGMLFYGVKDPDGTPLNRSVSRANILKIGSAVQAWSADLDALAALSSPATKLDGIEAGATADQSAAEILAALLTVDGAASLLDADLLDGIEASGFHQTGGTDVPVTDGGTGASTAAAARTNLGLAIGSDVQAWDADLDALAALTDPATKLSNALSGSTGATDNAILRADGTGGETAQSSAVTISDTGTLDITVSVAGTADPAITLTDGSSTASLYLFQANKCGIYSAARRQVLFGAGTEASGMILGFDKQLTWEANGSEFNPGTPNVGIAGPAAGVLRATNGSTGVGALLAAALVEANTAVAAGPNVLTGTESGTVFTNEGATAANYHTLPTAVAGLRFTFIVADTDGLRVVASTGDTIRIAGNVTATGGYIENTAIGSAVTLVAINATEWIAHGVQGSWTDGSWSS